MNNLTLYDITIVVFIYNFIQTINYIINVINIILTISNSKTYTAIYCMKVIT